MISKLTKSQLDMIPAHNDYWIKKSIAHTTDTDKEIQEKIKKLYVFSKQKPVKVIVTRSLKDFEKEVTKFIKSSVESSVWSSVWSSVRSSVRSSVESSVESSVFAGLYWFGDDYAYYDFFKKIGVSFTNDKELEELFELLEPFSYGILTDKIAIVLTKPKVRMNSNYFSHSDEGKAIEWEDGTGEYYLNGVKFEEALWTKIISRKMSLKDVMQIDDIDQRTQAMNYIPVQEFLEHAGGVVTDTFKKGTIEYKLYQIPQGLFTEIAYFATYTCPSTGKLYMSGISPEIGKEKNIVKAMAWKANMTQKDWKSMQLLTHES